MKNKVKLYTIWLLHGLFVLPFGIWGCQMSARPHNDITLGMGLLSGEVTQHSVILQTRLCVSDTLINGKLPGARGVGFFEVSEHRHFSSSTSSEWLTADSTYDFILKTRVKNLTPNTRYYYRVHFGPDRRQVAPSSIGEFKTLQSDTSEENVSFVVVTGMNYARHFFGRSDGIRKNWDGYAGSDRDLGYPALKTVLDMRPDFFIGTGDNVYYDRDAPGQKTAETQEELRQRWHEQFIQPRFVDMFAAVPTYWEKDDHDHRYNDSDTTDNGKLPDHQLGIATFLEQVPIVDPKDNDPKTYRTHRLGKHVQLWFTEGRDYRSPNDAPDGPLKTLWGTEQKAWLKRTLLDSDATFKILISPTPLVGPDDWGDKCDNHLNCFRHERAEFFDWLKKNEFDKKNFIIICGDRHWQYHAVDPSGFHEFSTGALVDGNARLGVISGDPLSTDPHASIEQPYLQPEPSGGFLSVSIKKMSGRMVVAHFVHYDEYGELLYQTYFDVR